MWRKQGSQPFEPLFFEEPSEPIALEMEPAGEAKPWLHAVVNPVVVLARWTAAAVKFSASLATLILTLAVLAATPILQFLVLGYLLEVGGRLARTGRWSQSLPGLHRVGRFGAILAAVWFTTLPVQFIAGMAADARLIDPHSSITRNLELFAPILAVCCFGHAALAAFRGRVRYFFRPINNVIWLIREVKAGGIVQRQWSQLRSWIRSLRLWYYFSLGFRGFCGAAFWLFIPATLLAVGKTNPLLGFLGGISMAVVVCWLPFLQLNFAAQNQFSAMFEVRRIRGLFRRTPIAYFIVFVLTLLLALPLYLLKIEETPRDAVWMLALLFIVTILPMKMALGWAFGRSLRKETDSWRLVSWPCKWLMAPVAIVYTYIVFLTQYTGWHGALSLYEHHAFLLPVPF